MSLATRCIPPSIEKAWGGGGDPSPHYVHPFLYIGHVGIFLLRFARKNLEETNAAVRIRNHVATSTISEKAVAFLFSAKFQLCEDVLQVELHNSFRLTSRFYPDSRRRLRLFFSIPTVCIVFSFLFKTLLHLFLKA